MNGINGLMDTIRRGVKPKEQKAVRGIITDGRVWVGARSYPFRTAIDCKTDDGCRVWVLISESAKRSRKCSRRARQGASTSSSRSPSSGSPATRLTF